MVLNHFTSLPFKMDTLIVKHIECNEGVSDGQGKGGQNGSGSDSVFDILLKLLDVFYTLSLTLLAFIGVIWALLRIKKEIEQSKIKKETDKYNT